MRLYMIINRTEDFKSLKSQVQLDGKRRKMGGMIFLYLSIASILSACDAGICWRRKFPDETCSGFHGTYNSEKECCEKGGVAYSKEVTIKSIFYYVFVKPPKCTLCVDPCSKIACARNWKCKVSSSGIPGCVCDPKCTDTQTGPVCGSDGRTYASKCQLQKRACISSRLEIEYKGPCRRNCANVQCSHKQVCIADKEGNSYCIHTHCPSTCPRAANQVCGTDNKAYSNLCSLKKASCLSGRKIHFAYLGPCTGKSSCNDVRCPEKSRCVLDINNQPRCEYCGCVPNEGGLPVCGSDGKKYKSWCHMRRQSCKHGRIIRVNPSLKC